MKGDNTMMWIAAGLLASIGVFMYLKGSPAATAAEVTAPAVAQKQSSAGLMVSSPPSGMNTLFTTGLYTGPFCNGAPCSKDQMISIADRTAIPLALFGWVNG